MRHLIVIFVLGGILFPPAAAQTTFTLDWQLPPGFPSGFSYPDFASRECLAILGDEQIFVLHGLPDPASVSIQVIPAPGLSVSGWSTWKLAEDTLVYRGIAQELILVRELPDNPTLVPTGIVGPSSGSLIAVNPTTAFDGLYGPILRHGPAGASLHNVTLPAGLTTGGNGFDAGPAGPDRFLVTGGSDHRTLIVFAGLSGPPSGFVANTYQIPGTGPLDGFLVTETGTGVVFQFTSSTEILLTLVRFVTGVPTFTTYSVNAPAWSSPAASHAVLEAAGDNVICQWSDGQSTNPSALVIGIDTTPQVAHTWSDYACCPRVRSLAPDELITGLVYPSGLTYHWFSGPNSGSRALSVPGSFAGYALYPLKPNPDTLVILSRSSSSTHEFWATVFTDLDGAATPHPIGITHYSSVFPSSPRLATVSPGMVAVLARALSPWPSLTFIGLPTLHEVAPSTMLDHALHLSPASGVPIIGGHFEILAWGAHAWTSGVWLAVATALGEPTMPGSPFDSFSTLHLDPAAFLGLVPAPSIGPGLWSVDLGLELFPPALTGLELYIQGVSLTVGTFGLGNTLLFIPG